MPHLLFAVSPCIYRTFLHLITKLTVCSISLYLQDCFTPYNHTYCLQYLPVFTGLALHPTTTLTVCSISLYLHFLIMVSIAFLPLRKHFMKIPALGRATHQLPTSLTVRTDPLTSCLKMIKVINLSFCVNRQ